MALEAFYNLNEKKKANLFKAIKFCLGSNKYEDISVGDIVEEAGISRGSFYNYFIDKDDAIYTVISESLKKKINYFKEYVVKNKGDIFASTIDLYENVKDSLAARYNENLASNMQIYITISVRILYSETFEMETKELIDFLMRNSDIGNKKIVDVDGMISVIDLLLAAIFAEMTKLYIDVNKKTVNRIKEKVEIIKNGLHSKK